MPIRCSVPRVFLMTRRQRAAFVCLPLFALLLAGCGALPALPLNPFGATPTVEVSPSPITLAAPSPTETPPTETPVPFSPFWVKNHRQTEMWSGQVRESGVVSFGVTSQQFCMFRVDQPPDGSRLYVFNPYSGGHFWIDAEAVGPVPDEPRQAGGPKPSDQNCADAVYAG